MIHACPYALYLPTTAAGGIDLESTIAHQHGRSHQHLMSHYFFSVPGSGKSGVVVLHGGLSCVRERKSNYSFCSFFKGKVIACVDF